VTDAPTLTWVKGRWRALSAFAAVVVSLVTAAIHPPPVDEARSHVAFGGFAAAVVTGLVYVLMRKRSRAMDTRAWWIAALVTVLLTVAVNVTYASMWDRYVVEYAGSQHVVGSELTEVGRKWVETRGESAPSDLLFAAAGQAELMWTPESIARNRRNFRLVYYACYPLFALSVLATVQAIHCARTRKRRKNLQSSM
jgi:bacteriorhodopsin